jgi:hypothetical protein
MPNIDILRHMEPFAYQNNQQLIQATLHFMHGGFGWPAEVPQLC